MFGASDVAELEALAANADLILVNPPFAGIDRPSLALHLLQAIAREEGLSCKIVYGNLLLAKWLGELDYERICYASSGALLGERFFAAEAYGKTPSLPSGRSGGTHIRTSKIEGDIGRIEKIYAENQLARNWCRLLGNVIAKSGAHAVGVSTTFEQTAASLALLDAIRAENPKILTLLGGANCEGEMGEGLSALNKNIDFIFSGESEQSFREWCREFRGGRIHCESVENSRLIEGTPCRNLDDLPLPDYEDFYSQIALLLPGSKILACDAIWLPFETSRGCWWGAKHHCTFCGINGEGMAFRQRDPNRAIADLKKLISRHPTNKILMLDNIMPHNYFTDFLPNLSRIPRRLHIFYEQKANLDFRRMQYLKTAGVEVIQPGIEALSSDLLRLMRKGIKARQNIALLRFALINNVFVNWNLLHSFPNDLLEWYEATRDLLPLLVHLCPPTGVFGLSIDRFSPYFDQSAEYGLSNVKPVDSYFDVLPEKSPVSKIAYHFEADYPCESREDRSVVFEIEGAVAQWRALWEGEAAAPRCHIIAVDDELAFLLDTRPGAIDEFCWISREQMLISLLGPDENTERDVINWALERRVCVEYEGEIVPLATCHPENYVNIDVKSRERLRDFDQKVLLNPDNCDDLISEDVL